MLGAGFWAPLYARPKNNPTGTINAVEAADILTHEKQHESDAVAITAKASARYDGVEYCANLRPWYTFMFGPNDCFDEMKKWKNRELEKLDTEMGASVKAYHGRLKHGEHIP